MMSNSRRVVFSVLIACAAALLGQGGTADRNSSLAQIELLIRQNRLDEAKTLATEEIRRNPSSVDAYNLVTNWGKQ